MKFSSISSPHTLVNYKACTQCWNLSANSVFVISSSGKHILMIHHIPSIISSRSCQIDLLLISRSILACLGAINAAIYQKRQFIATMLMRVFHWRYFHAPSACGSILGTIWCFTTVKKYDFLPTYGKI